MTNGMMLSAKHSGAIIGLLLAMLLQAYVVQISYNTVAPKILLERYRPLTYIQSLSLMLLCNTLFRITIYRS